jgi:N-acetylmuramoyl-L-alanine amidase
MVVVDPGHGGRDPGAVGQRRTREKDVVLNISKKLHDRINAVPGMRAVLTRKGDYYISLRGRIGIARKLHADLFVSVHADAVTRRSARGSSVYALSQRGATSETARLLADKENASDLVGGVTLSDKDDLLAEVLIDLSVTKTISESLTFGGDILRQLKRIGPVHSQRVEQAAFVVLKSPDIPSVLVETAYISNPQEEKLLRSDRHQNKIADAILSGIRAYLKRRPLQHAYAQ